MKQIEDKLELKEVSEAEFIATLPTSVAALITANNNVADLRIATKQDVEDIAGTLALSDRIKDQMQDWSLVTLHFLDSDVKQTYLLGDQSNGPGGPLITSLIKVIDLKRKLAVTRNGSLYSLGVPRAGEPTPWQLALLCIAVHKIGVGQKLGMPVFHKSILIMREGS